MEVIILAHQQLNIEGNLISFDSAW